MPTLTDETTAAVAAPYIEAVRVRIGRLPNERRAELLDDLRHHLAELAAEPDADLAEHLGDPDDFAEEYLTSAGVELTPRRPADAMRTAVRDRLTGFTDLRPVAAVLDFLPELRPAWWVARGYVPAAAVLADRGMTPWPFPDRHDDGSVGRTFGTVLAFVVAAASVWLGRRALEGRHVRLNRWVTIGGALAVLVATVSLNRTGVADASSDGSYLDDTGSGVYSPAGDVVYSAEGTPITNLWIFDAQGNPVRDVYVFDQDGHPVRTPVGDVGPATRIPVGPNGAPVVNRYPQDEVQVACGLEGSHYVPLPPPVVDIPGLDQPVTAPPSTAPPSDPSATSPSTVLNPPSTTIVPPNMGLPC